MLFGNRQPRPTPADRLAAKPVRLVEAAMQSSDEPGGRLTVPMKSPRFAGWLFRMPQGASKTYEFDAIGVFVWEQIDGRTTVQQLIRKLAKQFGLSEREAAVSTTMFLQTLGRKSLIGWSAEKK